VRVRWAVWRTIFCPCQWHVKKPPGVGFRSAPEPSAHFHFPRFACPCPSAPVSLRSLMRDGVASLGWGPPAPRRTAAAPLRSLGHRTIHSVQFARFAASVFCAIPVSWPRRCGSNSRSTRRRPGSCVLERFPFRFGRKAPPVWSEAGARSRPLDCHARGALRDSRGVRSGGARPVSLPFLRLADSFLRGRQLCSRPVFWPRRNGGQAAHFSAPRSPAGDTLARAAVFVPPFRGDKYHVHGSGLERVVNRF
jgi:hypothetical protein